MKMEALTQFHNIIYGKQIEIIEKLNLNYHMVYQESYSVLVENNITLTHLGGKALSTALGLTDVALLIGNNRCSS
jgi:hypothetical protein